MSRPHCVLLFATLVISGGCVTETECLERAGDATLLAIEDAKACTWQPEVVPEPDCSRTDLRPLLAYYASWCGTADPGCIASDTDADEVCFGSF